jgi:hypothetical protein
MTGALFLLTACTFDQINIPKTTPSVVVHAVLNTSSTSQVVLLERTLTGAVHIRDTSFDASNPIASDGGIPISGATVQIIDSTGRVFTGVEDQLPTTKKGTGVYRVQIIPFVRLGARYQLHVRTAEGEEVTASTRVPSPLSTSTGALSRLFNRDHDTLAVQWGNVQGARVYSLRVESPFGPFFMFTDSTEFHLEGTLRNIFSNDLTRMFIPGFRQDVLVAAVDSNYYDYYRTGNDPFTGSGIISRVTGGIGMFGAVVPLTTGTLNVIADQTEPIEGRFRLSGTSLDPTTPTVFTLYVEAKSTRADVPDAISGRYTTSGVTPRTDGIIGLRVGNQVSLALLANQLIADTVDVFVGELQGTTLTGTYKKRGGTAVFVKQ